MVGNVEILYVFPAFFVTRIKMIDVGCITLVLFSCQGYDTVGGARRIAKGTANGTGLAPKALSL